MARAMNAVIGSPRNRILNGLRDWDRAASDRVTHFIAISQTVRDRIAECYGRDAEVICPPVDVDYYTPAFVPREDYYLCVSALAPYKRIDVAIEACNRTGRKLVVIGAGPLERRLRKLAGPTVELCGWRSNSEIRDHLRRCRALVFPGYEDFGIVPLEAQACGTPVVALGRGGAAETVLPASLHQRGSGVLFHEQSPEALIAAMDWLQEHPQQFSPALAHRQAAQFHPARFERELLAFLDTVCSRQTASQAHCAPRQAAAAA
jgi:glycosyltransferase involved in cell wall biosynthesis